MKQDIINIFTDGSCHTQLNIGGWAAILLQNDEKIILKGKESDTTHNRMELLAVIKAIDFACEKCSSAHIVIHTDSQYVFRIPERMEKLTNNKFITKKGNILHNNDLIETLIKQIKKHKIEFAKVKAHQKNEEGVINYNTEVDILARQIVRDAVNKP